MDKLTGMEPIDYLVIGHLSEDITPRGTQLGGTSAYAALTAQALGMRVGILTSSRDDIPLGRLKNIPRVNISSEYSTTFENTYTPLGRIQKLHHVADKLHYYQIPDIWKQPKIIHIAPLVQELSTDILQQFRDEFICLTPQGWMREWDKEGNISPGEWPEADYTLRYAEAVVISDEDMIKDYDQLAEIAASSRVLVVTHGADGSSLYLNGEIHHIDTPEVEEVDPTGAGDIFAAAFFVSLRESKTPLEAAQFASHVAALSVTRIGLEGAPTKEDIYDLMLEVL